MVKRYKVDTRDGHVGIVEILPGVDYSNIYSREYVLAADYDELEAQLNPPIRLVLAALFMAARLIGNATAPRQLMIKDAIDDADELLRQVPP